MSTDNAVNTDSQRNAISLYSQEGSMDDFPVLKAFQQYIDAEQSRARKRMAMLCMVFCILMCAIVGVFVLMLRDVSERNQQLNDRLVEYVMKDRDRQTVVVQQPVPAAATPSAASQTNEGLLKSMTDALASIQSQMSKERDERRAAEAAAEAAAASQDAATAAAERELARKTQEAEERIRKARALLDADKKKLEEEKERLHREEVERHRRRLYPEYYNGKQDGQGAQSAETADRPAQSPASPSAPHAEGGAQNSKPQTKPETPKAELSDKDIEDILREAGVSDDSSDDEDGSQPSAANGKATKPAPDASDAATKDIDDAIEYFKDDEYQIPVEIKGKTSKWHVPLD